jgi:hypothetical protein
MQNKYNIFQNDPVYVGMLSETRCMTGGME